ncbi:unnamed protein product [Angiostrongylus costaricensis]|uniref:Uncharacterized protein n=1 Tax=Angiostrongylus costaricensis TaxID=334426 RepID=A0A0R3PXX8_ANGCS|nr:unnamed protein product [Angiostrongylus costaricensis]
MRDSVQNWSRYGLPHLQGDSMTADDACLDDDRLGSHVTCSAPCMTINITAIGGKHDGRVVGIVRDCQTYFHNPKSLPEGTTRMCRHSERETTRSQRMPPYFELLAIITRKRLAMLAIGRSTGMDHIMA